MLKIEIDGKEVEVEHGSTIIDAADKIGIAIPRFCYHKKLSVAANCRMCLVQVEKFAKPLPACATPVSDGMKIFTRSKSAIEAQKSVMEFLLINHPLDCPICDQGGECELQDIAVGYGGVASRYTEAKRVVVNKNIGPLIATDMTRCIQCTRCVRFLKEIGGMMELGLVGRGEHAEITAYVDKSVESELSGNIIDLCPVGALTSKPFRYSARSWELVRRPSIAPHDGLGSHIEVQVKDNRVMRVLPREKESINECWISDRDRFSYEGLNSADRLTTPMIKQNGEWREADWKSALEFVANRIRTVADSDASELGFLVSLNSTMEEGWLTKKIAKGLGCGNVDHRLRRSDFRLDGNFQGTPWMGCNIPDLQAMDRVLIIGSNLRNEHPLLTQRLRSAVKMNGAELSLINPLDDDPMMPVAHKVICTPNDMVEILLQVLKAVSGLQRLSLSLCLPPSLLQMLEGIEVGDMARRIAMSLAGHGSSYDLVSPRVGVFLGNITQYHPRYAEIYTLSEAIASLNGATYGVLSESNNRVGLNLARALPQHGALNARTMLERPRRAYVLLNVEPEVDCHNGQMAAKAMAEAEFVVALTTHKSHALRDADVLLPIAPFTETSGSYTSMEGRVQSFSAAVKPLGECRPGWKVLRVLGNLLGLDGFDFDSSEEVKNEIFDGVKPSKVVWNRLNNNLRHLLDITPQDKTGVLQRVGEFPLYRSDALVRRSPSLQKAGKSAVGFAAMNGAMLAKLGFEAGSVVRLTQAGGSCTLPLRRDDRVPDQCVRVPACDETVTLGDLFGDIAVEAMA
ncbi:NADH-quinone oxidoreductase chain 3 [mine drainage metagenome]|uniref:NADH-quinone oxidoreductase chain 3 n=1 Tax=mine drainage metagenome TaxID=410659 RepID=A0A1J5Q7S3_9ZZZZ